ncbi:MAG TPA: DUF1934 domain-containing protein [Firmicutes bacterium]|nr:DUF1934 domain-containing protein [Bacillota bacterium]
MKKEVLIQIQSTQKDGAEQTQTEFFTEGFLYNRNGKYYIVYREIVREDEAGYLTTLRIDRDDRITLMRQGDTKYLIPLESGIRQTGQIWIDYRSFLLGTYARLVQCQINDQGGRIDIEYTVDLNMSVTMENEIHITVREKT